MIKSFHTITRTFLTTKYLKFKVSRLPGEELVAMLPEKTTINELFSQIRHQFKLTESDLLASPAFTYDLHTFPVNQQMLETNENIKNEPFLPFLLANDLYIYEIKKQQAHLIYGLECLELNITNNRHIPEPIQTAILQLSQEWSSAQTVSQALKLPMLPNHDDSALEQQNNQVKEVLGKTAGTLEMLNNLKMDDPLREFVKKMTLLMGANWIFLYVVTFGYYGWDVGEPISYLSAVGVDLLAMLKVFEMDERINFQVGCNEGRWMGLLNLSAQKNRQRWLHRYLRRQLN